MKSKEKIRKNNLIVGTSLFAFGSLEALAVGALCPLCVVSGFAGLTLIKDNLKK